MCCQLISLNEAGTTIVDIEYLLEENKICLVTDDGNISTLGPFHDESPLEPFLEVPLDQSIQAVSWSPDQELVVLVCKDNDIFLLLDRFWNEIGRKELNPTEFGACSQVNVGWGSKATQFHGSEGKEGREGKRTISQSVFEWDDRVAKITWRRDGQMFAISSVHCDRRVIRIWNREAELQYTSEVKEGIENMLCWRPSGEIIATSQHLLNRHEISFIEPNGQPLGSFTLPFLSGSFTLHQIIWSSDSSTLCVWGILTDSSRQKLMLWTRNNYHWYLKQELVFDGEKERLSRVMFDPVSSKLLHAVFSSGSYLCLNFDWKICSSKEATVAVVDGSRLLVTCMSERIIPPPSYFYHLQFPECINLLSFDSSGNHLHVLTSSGSTVYTLSSNQETNANHDVTKGESIASLNGESSEEISSKKSIALDGESSEEISFKLSDVCSNSSNVINGAILNFHAKTTLKISQNEPVVVLKALQSCGSFFMTVQKTISGPSRLSFYRTGTSLPLTCLHILHSVLSVCEVAESPDTIALQMTDGRIYSLNVRQLLGREERNLSEEGKKRIEKEQGTESVCQGEGKMWDEEESGKKLKFMTKFNEPCLDFCVVEGIEKKWIAIGLSLTSLSLLLDQRILLKNCVTSFFVYDSSHLIVTCTDSTLQIWPLAHVMGKSITVQVVDHTKVVQLGDAIEKRTIERGSKIVTGITSKGSLVIQAVRGNLEVIHPRCLMWITVSKMINQDPPNFVSAFELMRKNRMNFNLIHDQNVDFFHSNISKFVDQISQKNIDYLVLFLTELSEQVESIPGYTFRDAHSAAISPLPLRNQSETSEVREDDGRMEEKKCGKVRRICLDMRQIMMEKGEEKITFFLHPILVTYFKCNQVSEGLILIKSLPDTSTRTDAIEFLKYMIDVNVLFNEALATYDMDIVLMVAQQSNKDPKEYLKLVNDFNQINPFPYRAFRIDIFLKRYERSLENISKCEEMFSKQTERSLENISKCEDKYFEEALQVIDSHRLYKKALAIYSQEEKVERIWAMFAEYLLSKKFYSEAGHAFSRSKNYLKSMKCYQMSGDWNAALRECVKLNDPIQTKLLHISLIDQLKSSGKFLEAASIAEKYERNFNSAFQILLDGYEWDHVSRLIVSKSNDGNLCESFQIQFWNKLQFHGKSLIERIEENSKKLNQYYLRLVEVRSEKEKLQVDGDDNYLEDTMSEIGSEFSSSSLRNGSTSSSRNSGSLRTRMTGSGKGAKKMKKKTLKIKEGSSYEDIALMNGYKEIVVSLDSLQSEVGLVLKHFICEYDFKVHHTVHFENLAIRLSSSFDHALNDLISKQVDLIWTYEVIEGIVKRLPSLSLSSETGNYCQKYEMKINLIHIYTSN